MTDLIRTENTGDKLIYSNRLPAHHCRVPFAEEGYVRSVWRCHCGMWWIIRGSTGNGAAEGCSWFKARRQARQWRREDRHDAKVT